jgi:hypothetical protein
VTEVTPPRLAFGFFTLPLQGRVKRERLPLTFRARMERERRERLPLSE